jgi:hypothetical protein
MTTTMPIRTVPSSLRTCQGCGSDELSTSFQSIPPRLEFVVNGKTVVIAFPADFTTGTYCVGCNAVYDAEGRIDRLRTKMLRDAREASRRRR